MNNKFISVVAIFLSIVAFSCKQKNVAEPKAAKLAVSMDDSSRVIIDRAIAYAGGYDLWRQKKTLSFDKKSTSYDSTGKVVRETETHLDYMMKPLFKAKLTYKLRDTLITLIHDGEKACKYYNGKASDQKKDIDGAWNSCYGSEYVMSMPYKLKDPGTKAEYVGQVTLADDVPAQVIKASYIKGAGSNPSHIWYYYFEPGTGKLLANSLNDKNNYWDYTRYTAFEKATGLLLPSERKGYTADTLNNQGRLISVSRHSNIVFDKNFPEDHFKIKDDN